MRIESVRVRNFGSIVDTEKIELDKDLTIFIGKNEQGKTNFLKALESFKKDFSYDDTTRCYLINNPFEDHESPVVTITFKLEDIEKDEFKKKGISIDFDEFKITKYRDNNYKIEEPDLNTNSIDNKSISNQILEILQDNIKIIKNRINIIESKLNENHINWLKLHQNTDGGFTDSIGTPSDLQSTYYVVKTLFELNSLNKINKEKVIQFILSIENSGGGFSKLPGHSQTVDCTYAAISILDYLNALEKIDKQHHINWLKSRQNADGGFFESAGDNSDINSTYFAIKMLFELNSLNEINKNDVVQFVLSTENSNGGFGNTPNESSDTDYTYNAISILDYLNALEKIDKQHHINWLKSLQNTDGGFRYDEDDNDSNMTYTYSAFMILMKLMHIDAINEIKLIEFILASEDENGGFGENSNVSPDVSYTYNAISILKDIQNYYVNLLDEMISYLSGSPDLSKINEVINNILNLLNLFKNKEISEIIISIEDKKGKIKEDKHSVILEEILELLPNFVYFENFENMLIKDKISIDDYLSNIKSYQTFKNLFNLCGLDIQRVKHEKDPHTRNRLFKDASMKITGYLDKYWKQEEIEIKLVPDGNLILVVIEDGTGAKSDPPSKRSEGFRWFLSFYIYFMESTKNELKNAILLLDNPGWVLHPSGQKDLLKTLEEISKNNQIAITTHSPFLIDKNKLEKIRIVRRDGEEGTKIYQKFWHCIYDALQIIRSSIGVTVSDSLFGHKNNLIVEGFSDQLYIEAIANYFEKKGRNTIDLKNIMIVSAGSADKVPTLLAIYIAEKYNVLSILDSDSKGDKVIRNITKLSLPIDINNDILKLDEIDVDLKSNLIAIEDLFDEEIFNIAVNHAYKKIKGDEFEIKIEELPSADLITKRYEKLFKEKNYGGFDKIKVAKEMKLLLDKNNGEVEKLLNKTITNFENLFIKIGEKYNTKGIDSIVIKNEDLLLKDSDKNTRIAQRE